MKNKIIRSILEDKNKLNLIFSVLLLTVFSMIMPMEQEHKTQDVIDTNIDEFNKENYLTNLPDELLINIITEVIQSHINKWNDISEFDNEEFKKDVYSMISTCKRFNDLGIDAIKTAKNLKRLRFEYISNNIKKRYKRKYLSKIELNKELTLLLNIAVSYCNTKKALKECVRLIIAGANINGTAKHGETTLMIAATRGYIKILELLIYIGADINAKNIYGHNALILAARLTANENEHDISKHIALTLGARCDRIKIVKLLINMGANINATDNSGNTVLMWAARYCHIEMLRLLIDMGADINAKNHEGDTALMCAVKNMWAERIEIIRLLINRGANINTTNHEGDTALMIASWLGYVKIVKLLIDLGADVNLKDKNGYTALMIAKQREQDSKNHKDIVKLLEPKKDAWNAGCILS